MTLTTPLKLHLRVLEVHGRTLRVVTLRPQIPVRFSTNYFHDTWHILAGSDGAALFGRLLWGLAFQRHPGTMILIDDSHLVPTPFEGDPPDPILVIPDGLTHVDDDMLRALKLRLRRAPGPPTTIRWHTFGMQTAFDQELERRRHWRDPKPPIWRRERMSRRAGFVCYTAPPEVLRHNALGIYRMHGGDGYYPMAVHDGTWHYDGELQVIPSFASKVSAARVARREACPEDPGRLLHDGARAVVYDHADSALRRLVAARRRQLRP
jgi:hypothetical protein